MLSVFSCVCYPFVCLLWRNVCLVLWPIFWLGCLFFWNWAAGVACIFLRLILYQLLCYYILPFWRLSFHIAYILLRCAKAFKVPLVYFCFYFHYSGMWIIEDPAVIYVGECFAYVSSRSFLVSSLTFRSLIHFEFIFVYGVRKWSSLKKLKTYI